MISEALPVNRNIAAGAGGNALPMGTSGQGNLTLKKLIEAGKALDRQGLTKAGRGHAKAWWKG